MIARARARGLTLVEVMAVAAIIGVLAVLAYVGYGRYVRTAKATEATNMVGAIREAQENYKNTTGVYLNVSGGLGPSNLYPAPPGTFRTPWGGACSTCATPTGWKTLDVKSDAPVWFGYATVAGIGTVTASLSTSKGAVDFLARNRGVAVTGPWYVVVAQADTNGDGVYWMVEGDSFTSELLVDNEGE
jgi:prepilin-type N-terminal cleavage/methylation domain-containing protein